jgi:UDP-2-acetamido-3-amino-2,3-dideoxy-glucuronate N-acetyltransferase
MSWSPSLGLIGAGSWGKNLARNFNELGALHTLCDVDEQILGRYEDGYEKVRKVGDVAAVLSDQEVTMVAIAAPAAQHHELAKAALEAGKDVLVEKPLCLDDASGKELLSLAKAGGRILMVGHLLQYHPCIQKLRAMVAEGILGKLHYITSNRLNLGKIRSEENALWSFAPHDISVILSLAGDQLPERVRSVGEAYLNREVVDTTLTMLRFVSGLRAHVYVSWLNPFKEQKLTVVGSEGLAVFDDTQPWSGKLVLHRQYLNWVDGQAPRPSDTEIERVVVEESEPLRNECVHFLECCQSRSTPSTDGEEGLRVLQTLEAAQESLNQDGETVRVNDPRLSQAMLEESGARIHPSAVVDPGAIVGDGTRIWHFTHVSEGSRIGERCTIGQNTFIASGVSIGNNVKVQNNVSIYTGVTIEDDVFLGPSCVFTNVTNPRSQVDRHELYEKTRIRKGASIGANATIVCGANLGRYSFVAAGAVVTRDVADYALVVGSPARRTQWMSRHGHVLEPGDDGLMVCPESGYRYREVEPGCLRCLDLDEDDSLPASQASGQISYRSVKRSS